MKTIIILAIASILLVGCSIPKNPKLSWGKKCTVQGNQVVWSHLWIYDKNERKYRWRSARDYKK